MKSSMSNPLNMICQVDELMEKFYNELKKTFTEEIGHLVDSAGAYVKNALQQASNYGANITVDVNNIDNM